MLAVLAGCGSPSTDPATTSTTTTAAASLQLSASATSVPTDNSATTTITVTALDGSNAALSGITVSLAANTGIVSAPSVTTDSTGTATFTFSSGTANQANRTATITASAGATAQIPIQIVGSTLKWVSTSATTIPNDGSATSTVVFQVLNGGTAMVGSAFTAGWSTGTGGQLTVTPTSGVTDSNGNITLTAKGVAGTSGTANVLATAVGSTASAPVTVSPASSTFAITNAKDNTTGVSTANPTVVAMYTSDTLTVTASAPAAVTSVTFVTSAGSWVGGTTSVNAAVGNCGAGLACATLTGQQAGTTSITAVGNTATGTGGSANLTVSVTASTPFAITLQASPATVPKSTGSSSGISTLIATVVDASGNPVGNAPVAFSLSNTTGGGESVAPVVAYTAAVATTGLALGQASATFTSGSLSSDSDGVQVHAAVLGTSVATYPNNVPPAPGYITNPGPSGNDAKIMINGTAGSIAFGIATKILVPNDTTYQQPMSVLVSDVSGNPVAGAVVTLSVWPSAWSTGTQYYCTPDPDNGINQGTFVNEDINGNLTLDPGEDGYRKYLATGTTVSGGTKDAQLTPVNSMGGSVPMSVTTDANGLANFNLTYLKASAIWTIDTIRATTQVQGSATVSQTTFRLPAAQADTGNPPTATTCFLYSPYTF